MSCSESLLHVEDDEFITRSLRRWFERRGFTVTGVASCAEARAQSATFECGVFDIDLPDGDGIGLASELLERRIVGRVVFYTATTDGDATARASRLGPVVTKGDDLSKLLRALTRAGDSTEHSLIPVSGVDGPASSDSKANAS
jgi:ActR/RegA family two-component response regulator